MNIGILDAGNAGKILGEGFVKSGHSHALDNNI
ncbi:MAG: hypothetical protein K0R55_3899 [Sporomusa sp.]|nr:hypothetical protein [Sporomusa sp.]